MIHVKVEYCYLKSQLAAMQVIVGCFPACISSELKRTRIRLTVDKQQYFDRHIYLHVELFLAANVL